MKQSFIVTILFFVVLSLGAQAPEKMSYQAVVRNAAGELIMNKKIGVQVIINKDGKLFPTTVYSETHTPTTNANGLITLEVGNGTVITGNFSTIDWGAGSYTLNTSYDLSGGTNYGLLGSSKLLSVPYALYAKSAGNATGGGTCPDGTAVGEIKYWNGESWITVSPSLDGKVLTLDGGVPVWKEQQTITLNLPTVITIDITDVSGMSAMGGGNVLNEGSSAVTAKGVCWSSTNSTPTIYDLINMDGNGLGSFSSSFAKLIISTTYYVRAYAINSLGVSYGSVKTFTTANNGTFTDSRDNTVYKTVVIGNQVWMAENLRYLPSVVGPTTKSETLPCYYVYNNNNNDVASAKASNNFKTYGVLYNWEAAKLSCPSGWHLPSEEEFMQLFDYLGGAGVAGSKLKEKGSTHWYTDPINFPSAIANNESGFTALAGGYYDGYDVEFNGIIANSYWWGSTKNKPLYLYCYHNQASIYTKESSYGFYVRCIKD